MEPLTGFVSVLRLRLESLLGCRAQGLGGTKTLHHPKYPIVSLGTSSKSMEEALHDLRTPESYDS